MEASAISRFLDFNTSTWNPLQDLIFGSNRGFWNFKKRSLLIVYEVFEILSNEKLGQKAGFSKDSIDL
ncbi:MAG: hypothetical protein AAF620_16400 [Bacteroidota bacterium]